MDSPRRACQHCRAGDQEVHFCHAAGAWLCLDCALPYLIKWVRKVAS